MIPPPAPEQDGTPPSGLRRMRGLAAAVLWFERLWPAVAPALGLLGVFASAALLDLPRLLSPSLHMAALAMSGVAVLALLGIGLSRVRRPLPTEADRRLEADSGLRHQPLAVLSDRPAAGGEALWAAHVARARAQISRLRLRAPRPMLAAVDRRALRALVVVMLAVSLGVAGPDAAERLAGAMNPRFVPPPAPPAPQVQAWITPPSYTGLAPIFLKADGSDATVPGGSQLTINVTGAGPQAPTLEQSGHSDPFQTLDATSFQIEQTLTANGRVSVRSQGRDMVAWTLSVVPNDAPMVVFPEPPGTLRSGPNPQTRLPWQVTHAYGVASLQGELHLGARPEAPPLLVPIPLPGTTPKSAKGARVMDLTAHPWAGLEVSAQLAARDAAGLEGRSAVVTLTLPERRFTNPLARALVAVRKQLSLTPNERSTAVTALNQMSSRFDVWDSDIGSFVNLRAIASLLYRGRMPDTVPQAQDRLWSLALHLEEGALDRTARALEAARQQLHDALEADKRGEKADKTDLDKRMRDLQEALQKRLQALTDQVHRDPESNAYDPEAHPMDQRDMQRLTQEMRDAARDGKNDTARDKLAELEKMMEALKESRPERGQMTERERQRAEKRQRGQQQMTALQDMIRREGDLLDRAQARAATNDPLRNPPAATASDARRADQRIQLALRRAVGELMQQYGDLTGTVPPNLAEADTAMRDGAQALGQARDAQAAQSAQKAIEALQKGGQSMQQQMARQFGRGPPQAGEDGDEGEGMAQGEGDGDGEGNGPGQGGRQFGNRPGDGQGGMLPNSGRQQARRPGQNLDPLGRPRGEGTSGTDEAGDVQVPDEMEAARTRALQEELRRRGADRTRPQDELDYIDRLLRQF